MRGVAISVGERELLMKPHASGPGRATFSARYFFLFFHLPRPHPAVPCNSIRNEYYIIIYLTN